MGENVSFELLIMDIGSPVRPVEVSKKIIGKEREGKPNIKSHTSGIFHVVVET